MKTERISRSLAQKLMLSSQWLNKDSKNTLDIIEHLGYIQLDTISVVERAHHHVLWTRNSKYNPEELNQLMKKRKVYEYWSHAASVLPMSEYRYSLALKKIMQKKTSKWFPTDKKMMNLVLKRIKDEGPLQSKDFQKDSKKAGSGWWDWKPAKKTLERLFLDGGLEVSHRDSFRKVYDLPENVIPSKVNTKTPTDKEFYAYLINRTIRHQGLASIPEIAYLFDKKVKDGIQKVALELIENGKIVALEIDGIKETYYTFPQYLESKMKASSRVHILSPFDNFVIQRNKMEHFFDFQYQIECYVPEKKRKYGYFCLPIFKGTKGIGRIDCKVDRPNKTLIVKSVHSENDYSAKDLASTKLKAFAKFNGCNKILWPK